MHDDQFRLTGKYTDNDVKKEVRLPQNLLELTGFLTDDLNFDRVGRGVRTHCFHRGGAA